MLFQKLCQGKTDWDEVLSDELVQEWKSLIMNLNVASPVCLPRGYMHDVEGPLISATLCCFCDASTRAYAAVVYLRMKTELY